MASTKVKIKDRPLDIRQSREYANFLTRISWQVECSSIGQVFIKKLPIIGSALKIQRTTKINLKEIYALQKKHRAFLTIVEPEIGVDTKPLINAGFKLTNSSYLPTKSLVVNLVESKEKILSQMKKDARYGIRKSEHEGLEVFNDTSEFQKNWKGAVNGKLHVLPVNHLNSLKSSFGKNIIFLQSKDKEAGAIFIVSGKKGYYWVGFYSDTARKKYTSYKIILEGILWCKKQKAEEFDFEGIIDERFPKTTWSGFSHFKKSFGGSEIYYPGCFVKWF